MEKLNLNGMMFYAFHGCLEHEKRVGNRFRVDFECEYPMLKGAKSDNLEDALNYAAIYQVIKAQMAIPSNLIENVAYRILEAVKSRFPQIGRAQVTVAKFNPPVDGEVQSSSVTLSY
ncbi:MAG: dihydroneopterin aldolase [Bacteroidales bacterium]|nr:dihydroneopterin aldolase [Bacteroidales bacterium]MDD3201668.1 dihydroneopterin aldolase [Bacteroidales bacterium]